MLRPTSWSYAERIQGLWLDRKLRTFKTELINWLKNHDKPSMTEGEAKDLFAESTAVENVNALVYLCSSCPNLFNCLIIY